MTLHDYFKDFPIAVGKCKDNPDKIKDILKPLVSPEELFDRTTSTDLDEDRVKLTYVFLDGSRGIRGKRVNEDWFPTHPVMYIGKGEIDRPLKHFWGDNNSVNIRFRDWLEYMKKNDLPVYILIYSCDLSDKESLELEADLINLVESRVQSLNTGARIYSSKNAPIRMFNSKFETSNQRVYSVRGNRQRIPIAADGSKKNADNK